MSKDKKRSQRVDHNGNYVQIPRQLLTSAAFLSLSLRARSALYVLLERFNGFNNGRIGLSIDNLGAALGNQNHAANSRALAELMERGFIECMATANHVKSKAREYRLTFAESGPDGKYRATNEWRSWKLPQKNGPEATATRKRKPVEATATQRNIPVEATATRATETCGVGGRFRVEATAAHIISQYEPAPVIPSDVETSFKNPSELRAALNDLVAAGEVTATAVAMAIGMPSGTMSKFRGGRGLPDAYRGPLHLELGRLRAFSMPSRDAGVTRSECPGAGAIRVVGDALCWRDGDALKVVPAIAAPFAPSMARIAA